MKNLLPFNGCLLLVATMFFHSCNDKYADESGVGAISLKATLNISEENLSVRATPTDDFSGYSVILHGPTGVDVYPFPQDGKISALPVGNYTITVTSHAEDFIPAFDEQHYSGSSSVYVSAGDTVAAYVNCVQVNAGVFFVYDESLAEAGLSEVVPHVKQGEITLIYQGENRLTAGYFNPGEVGIDIYHGSSLIENRRLTVGALQLWQITLSAKRGAGEISLDVSIEELTDPTHTDEIELEPANGFGETVGSNAYIVKPSTKIEIPVQRAFQVWEKEPLNDPLPENGNMTAEVLWEDTQDIITAGGVVLRGTGRSAVIEVQTDLGARSGNAIIILKIDNIIRWNWHLWITDYDPDNAGTTYTYNNGTRNYTIMDRNLGAITDERGNKGIYGLHYQWGRKDPMPGYGTVNNNVVTIFGTQIYSEYIENAQNLAYATMNPHIFFTQQWSGYFDWYTSVEDRSYQNDYLWCDQQGRKTDFDPCPEGWRVPVWTDNVSPWEGRATSTFMEGYEITVNGVYIGFWPAAGHRLGGSGQLAEVGTYGYYWGAGHYPGNSLGENAQRTTVWYAMAGMNSFASRMTGHSVRCEKDNF